MQHHARSFRTGALRQSLAALSFAIFTCAIFTSPAPAAPPSPAKSSSARPLWVTAYYPVWHQQDGTLTPAMIDYTAFSHLVHFSIVPKPDGTIDDAPGVTITPAESQAVIAPAHAAGRKVLVCVGGWQTAPRFRAIFDNAVRPRFIANLVQFVVTRGYDGVDIDMEPLTAADTAGYESFIRELRAALTAARPGLLLTAAVVWQPAMFAQLQDQFDQINLMTYDLSGPWQGFQTWHNASLYGAGVEKMSGSQPYPSVQEDVQKFVQAGVAKSKIGIGIAFFGYVWSGATGPRQSIQGVTTTQVAYRDIMDTYYQPSRYHWDAQAHAPYLSIASPLPADQKFISFDDARLCAEKVRYVRQQGLGGVILWELGGGYRPGQPKGQKDPLLQAVKRAWRGP